jgi:hypothetical protein
MLILSEGNADLLQSLNRVHLKVLVSFLLSRNVWAEYSLSRRRERVGVRDAEL